MWFSAVVLLFYHDRLIYNDLLQYLNFRFNLTSHRKTGCAQFSWPMKERLQNWTSFNFFSCFSRSQWLLVAQLMLLCYYYNTAHDTSPWCLADHWEAWFNLYSLRLQLRATKCSQRIKLSCTSVNFTLLWKCSAVCFEVWNASCLLQCVMECNSV